MSDPLLFWLIAGLIVSVALLFLWPQSGLFWRWRRSRQTTERVLIEDALKHIQQCEMSGRRPTMQSIAGAVHTSVNQAAELLSTMEARKLVQMKQGEFYLTPAGRDYAMQVIRAHRLWERYLADQTGFVEDEWHAQAHRREHMLSPDEIDSLSKQLGNPTHDPHGDPIPTAAGTLVSHGGRPITTLATNDLARIVHLEDEPPAVFAQLVAEGLWPGMHLHLTEISPERVRFWANGDEHVLAPIVADNISVVPLPQPEEVPDAVPGRRLGELKPGETAQVVGISPASRGIERRRLLDLGFLPGTLIGAEMTSPSGDPTAYRIRGAVIALRREQADHIHITRQEEVV